MECELEWMWRVLGEEGRCGWVFILGTGGATVDNKVADGDGLEGVTDIAVVGIVFIDAGFIVAVNETKVTVEPYLEMFHEDYKNVVVERKIIGLRRGESRYVGGDSKPREDTESKSDW